MNEKPEALYITLPREVVEQAWWHIEWFIDNRRGGLPGVRDAAAALLKALNAPSLSSPPENEALRRENERLREELRQSSIDITRAEVERLREALKVCFSHWLNDDNPDELQGNVARFKELCDWNAALRREDV